MSLRRSALSTAGDRLDGSPERTPDDWRRAPDDGDAGPPRHPSRKGIRIAKALAFQLLAVLSSSAFHFFGLTRVTPFRQIIITLVCAMLAACVFSRPQSDAPVKPSVVSGEGQQLRFQLASGVYR
ncbi:MAG: hypothetical protein KDI53_17990, partial [Candidatus Accumulibacter sp.]|nr:hypothetical protein [Accumulibacter sp.]